MPNQISQFDISNLGLYYLHVGICPLPVGSAVRFTAINQKRKVALPVQVRHRTIDGQPSELNAELPSVESHGCLRVPTAPDSGPRRCTNWTRSIRKFGWPTSWPGSPSIRPTALTNCCRGIGDRVRQLAVRQPDLGSHRSRLHDWLRRQTCSARLHELSIDMFPEDGFASVASARTA